jgi:hypothetical protein
VGVVRAHEDGRIGAMRFDLAPDGTLSCAETPCGRVDPPNADQAQRAALLKLAWLYVPPQGVCAEVELSSRLRRDFGVQRVWALPDGTLADGVACVPTDAQCAPPAPMGRWSAQDVTLGGKTWPIAELVRTEGCQVRLGDTFEPLGTSDHPLAVGKKVASRMLADDDLTSLTVSLSAARQADLSCERAEARAALAAGVALLEAARSP